jgi:hypothetical protein
MVAYRLRPMQVSVLRGYDWRIAINLGPGSEVSYISRFNI